jgi:hypothetical protein
MTDINRKTESAESFMNLVVVYKVACGGMFDVKTLHIYRKKKQKERNRKKCRM